MSSENKQEANKINIKNDNKASEPHLNKINLDKNLNEKKQESTEKSKNINPNSNTVKNKFSWRNKSAMFTKIIKPGFLFGFLLGSTLSYYLHDFQINAYINNRETFLNEEIKLLEKEIKGLKIKN